VLRELFDLRSQIEQLHLATGIIPGSREERIERVNRRTRQADALARFAIGHVLETPDLFENVFDEKDHLQAFWAVKDGARVIRWGPRIEIVKIL
jgi:hypothetical protein